MQQSATASRRILLPTAEALCDAFFHIKDTPEAAVEQACLRGAGCCGGKTTCLIVRLMTTGDAGSVEHFVELYRNEAKNSCAEGFLMRDERLLACVDALGGKPSVLHIYLTQQPCHFSSSNDSNSCTENLLRWWERWMEPRGVGRLRIAAAYPYRTHWDERHMSEDDLAGLGRRQWGGRGRGRGRRAGGAGSHGDRCEAIERARRLLANAREGTRILASSAGASLDAFTESDWEVVLSVCDPTTAALYHANAPPFTPDVKARRAALDSFTKAVFDGYRPTAARPVPADMELDTSVLTGPFTKENKRDASSSAACTPCIPEPVS